MLATITCIHKIYNVVKRIFIIAICTSPSTRAKLKYRSVEFKLRKNLAANHSEAAALAVAHDCNYTRAPAVKSVTINATDAVTHGTHIPQNPC